MKKEKIINLDVNASFPINKKTVKRTIKILKLNGSPFLNNFLGNKLKTIIEKSKKKIAKKIKIKKNNIIFTPGSSQSIKQLLEIIVLSSKKKITIISSYLEHNSINDLLINYKKKKKIKLFFFKKKKKNILKIKKKKIKKADVIFLTLTNNETGIIIKNKKIKKQIKKKTIIISDFSNSIKYIKKIDKRIDIIILSSHKIGAIIGIGILIIKKKFKKIRNKILYKQGTEPTVLIDSFANNIQNIIISKKKNKKILKIKNKIEKIIKKKTNKIKILYSKNKKINNLVIFCINTYNIEIIKLIINLKKICLGYGSACNSIYNRPNKNLIFIGLTSFQAKNIIRITFNEKDKKKKIIEEIKKIKNIINKIIYHPSFLNILFLIFNSFTI